MDYAETINHLAHFLLVNKLRGLLEKNSPSRVILVSSLCHSWEPIDWDDLQAEKNYEKYVQYSKTKLMNHLFAFALHRRLKEANSGLASLVMEPGVIHTKLLRNGMGSGGAAIEYGPRTEVYCASEEGGGESGAYYDDRTKNIRADAKAYVEADQERLWEASLILLREKGIQI